MSNANAYQDPSHSVETRVEDLLNRMTLEEKVGQMCQMNGRTDRQKWLQDYHAGSFLHMLGHETNDLQELAEQTRLGIPILFGIDAIHGHAFWPTATIFPSQLGLSCTWNPDLIEQIGRITAKEVACTGVHWTFSPVLDIARDLRWGRIGETFGEDPTLAGALGAAIVRGYQGDDLADPTTILACAKHYAGYSETQGGRDSTEADLPQRKMRSLHLQPFRQAVQAGCATVMAGYHAIDGVPCSANRWLLRDVLREEWGFEGFIVSDWKNLEHMRDDQKVVATMEEAVQLAIEAGNEMFMNTPDFVPTAIHLVRQGRLDPAHIDAAVRRILRLKFKLGLFDHNRYADLEAARTVIGCEEHRAVALEAACQSIVLLKNRDSLLPLDSSIRRLAVIGPNANDAKAQLGDWVAWSGQLEHADLEERPRESIVTILDGIRRRVGSACRVDYERGCAVADPTSESVSAAAELARGADAAIVVVGDDLSLTGEARDRADLDLSGAQQQLLEAVHDTGTPIIVILVSSKPLTIPWVAEHADAVLVAWNPGIEGGAAVASILFGDRNPSGRLTVSFPYHVGQQPVTYNQWPGWHGEARYADMPRDPLFPFGYGLSYTTFAYSNLRLLTKTLAPGEPLRLEVDVHNTGQREGTEVVQLYVNDLYSSVTTPLRELKAFRRVELKPGQRTTVELEVPYESLALVNQDLETLVEPGQFEVMVGSSSRDQDLLKDTFVAQ